MGVQDKAKYIEIKDLLDIPDVEPIFILRAQDVTALPCLEWYAFMAASRPGDQTFVDGVMASVREFRSFAQNHPEAMKEPD